MSKLQDQQAVPMVVLHLEGDVGVGEGLLLIDEQSYKIQEKSEYKTQCGKFKRLVDGIQGDCITDNGYAWDFTLETSPLIKSSLHRETVPCTANCSTCFGICMRVLTAAYWITF
jgi:hypothetical protein